MDTKSGLSTQRLNHIIMYSWETTNVLFLSLLLSLKGYMFITLGQSEDAPRSIK